MTTKTDVVWRMALVSVIVGFLLIMVFVKAFFLMTVRQGEFLPYAVKDKSIVLQPRRGDILADDGMPLATSVPFYDIYVDMRRSHIHDTVFRKADSLALGLSRVFRDKDRASYRRLLNESRRRNNGHYLIHRRASYDELQAMKKLPIFRKGAIRGGYIAEVRSERIQPLGGVGGRTIGECYRENESGRSGLEEYFNDILKGVPGEGLSRRAAGSSVKVTITEPENGRDIVTTINAELQDIVSDALMKHMEYQMAKTGCAILMEVETGDIKAMANLSRVGDGRYAEMENMAVGGAGEPGSVMKAASAISLFEAGDLKPNDTVHLGGKGVYIFQGQRIKDSEGHAGFDVISFKDAFKYSLNGIAKVVNDRYAKNPAKFLNYWYDMRLNEPVGICLSGEPSPVVRNPDHTSWDSHFNILPWMSIGYSVTITPLQLCAFYNAIANDGQRMRPRLVKEIRDNGRVVESFPVERVGGRMFGRRTKEYMDSIMCAVVEDNGGTAHRIKSDYYRVAGKTGTAYISGGKQGYGNAARCTFAGFFPADNPKYTCVVVIDRPRVNSSGAGVSAPVFKDIADKIVALMSRELDFDSEETISKRKVPTAKNGYAEDMEYICDELDIPTKVESSGDWVSISSRGGEFLDFSTLPIKDNLLPNVVGMGIRDAVYLMECAGVRVSVSGAGRVVSQSLSPGSKVVQGSMVHLSLR